jgi:hypothetical protein
MFAASQSCRSLEGHEVLVPLGLAVRVQSNIRNVGDQDANCPRTSAYSLTFPRSRHRMDVPDPRTRSQISLNPQGYATGSYVPPKILHYLPNFIFLRSGRPKTLSQTAFVSAVTATALFTGRQWLLLKDVGVFWLLIRILACGGIGVFSWAAWTDQLKHARRKSVEVRPIEPTSDFW